MYKYFLVLPLSKQRVTMQMNVNDKPAREALPAPHFFTRQCLGSPALQPHAGDTERVLPKHCLAFERARRIAIKVGSTLMVDSETGRIRHSWLNALVKDIAQRRERGQQVVVVCSGAVAVGRHYLALANRPLRREERQAAASTGQVLLMEAHRTAFGRQGIRIGQMLLTSRDTESWQRHLNARSTLNQLLANGTVPIINENDATSCEGSRIGDNDRLAARVAQMLRMDMLVLLSDVAGMYTADPSKDPKARLLTEVREITPEIQAMAGGVRSCFGSGGMVTKLAAAQIAMNAGCDTIFASGKDRQPLTKIAQGAKATWFKPRQRPWTGRKAWVVCALETGGAVVVDAGAAAALQNGKSLLPVGIVAVDGSFDCGDTIAVCDQQGRDIARGITAYSNQEVKLLAGHRSYVFERLFGADRPANVIHRDNLVLNGRWRSARGRGSQKTELQRAE